MPLASLLPPASAYAAQHDELLRFILIISAGIFVLVAIQAAVCLASARRDEPQPASAWRDGPIVQILWTLLPVSLLGLIFVWGFKLYIDVRTPPPGAYTVTVESQGGAWRFTHLVLENKQESGELHVPAERPVRLVMRPDPSPERIWLPAFRLSLTAAPDSEHAVWFQAEAPRRGDSAEYAGGGSLPAKVIVMKPAAFARWVEGEDGPPEGMTAVAWGEALAQKLTCRTCHSVDGSALIGPSWKGLYGSEVVQHDGSKLAADEDYLRRAILDPGADVRQGFQKGLMPPLSTPQGPKNIASLVEYLKSLK